MKSFDLKLELQSKFRARQNMVSTLGSPHKGGQVMQLIYMTLGQKGTQCFFS